MKLKSLIGRAVRIDFPELKILEVPARVDTGAKTSAIWATNIVEKDGRLEFTLFDKKSEHYTGETVAVQDFSQTVVSNSFGIIETRYRLRLLVIVDGRKIRALFTLANREAQVYPVLIGRNILRGKFVVDVKQGMPLVVAEQERSKELKEALARRKGKENL